VSTPFELDRLRSAGLSPFDVNVLNQFMKVGGEFTFYAARLKPQTKDIVISGMNSLIARGLIEVDTNRSIDHRWMLRLTDNGRAICAKLDEMSAKPAVEVQMQGDAPRVIQP
jgi:hypothetical protein